MAAAHQPPHRQQQQQQQQLPPLLGALLDAERSGGGGGGGGGGGSGSGSGSGAALRREYERHRLASLALSRRVSLQTSQAGGVTWLDLDGVEQRFLLLGSADATLEAFDVLAADDGGADGARGPPQRLRPLFTIRRGAHPGAHRFAVSALCWFGLDTGLFVTGGADAAVKVWDSNALAVACAFDTRDKVTALAMSPCASAHASLVAVGTKASSAPHTGGAAAGAGGGGGSVVLADVASGGFAHTLSGHAAGVWAACWSPANEHQLLTGDAAGEVRLWDVRRSGCQALLDMTATQPHQQRRPLMQQQQRQRQAAGGGGGRGGGAAGPRGAKRKRGSAVATAATAAAAGSSYGGGGGGDGDDDHVPPRPGGAGPLRELAHEGAVTGLLATPDGLHLLSAGADGRVRLWDAQRRTHLLVHYAHTAHRGAYPKRLACTPDGRVVFVPSGDGDVRAFDVATGRQVALLSQGHYEPVTGVAYSALTGRVFTASVDGAVLAWEPWLNAPPPPPRGAEAAPHAADWWLVAAAGGRGRSRGIAPPGGGGGSSSGEVAAAAAAAAAIAEAADVDLWSDDADDAGIG